MSWASTGIFLLIAGWVVGHIMAMLGAAGLILHQEGHLGNRILGALAILAVMFFVDGLLFIVIGQTYKY